MAKKAAKKKTPAKAAKKKAAKPAETLSHVEVAALDRDAQAQKKAEQSWQALTGAAPDGAEDSWASVEEKLVRKPQESAHSERRWKYFSK